MQIGIQPRTYNMTITDLELQKVRKGSTEEKLAFVEQILKVTDVTDEEVLKMAQQQQQPQG